MIQDTRHRMQDTGYRIQVKSSACIMNHVSCIKHYLSSIIYRASKIGKSKIKGQSIAEYSILFVAITVVLVFAVNGPVRASLQGTFQGLIDAIKNCVGGLI